MLKHIAAITFYFCYILLVFQQPITLFQFYMNQDAIIAQFCVNKNRPQLHCDGKCFLAKKIKEQEKKEASNAIMELTKIEIISSIYFLEDYCNRSFCYLQSVKPMLFEIPLSIGNKAKVFRPPIYSI